MFTAKFVYMIPKIITMIAEQVNIIGLMFFMISFMFKNNPVCIVIMFRYTNLFNSVLIRNECKVTLCKLSMLDNGPSDDIQTLRFPGHNQEHR